MPIGPPLVSLTNEYPCFGVTFFLEYKLGQTLKAGSGESKTLVAISIIEKVKIRLHAMLNIKDDKDFFLKNYC